MLKVANIRNQPIHWKSCSYVRYCDPKAGRTLDTFLSRTYDEYVYEYDEWSYKLLYTHNFFS